MNKNYLTYPCKVMRITQSYTGTTSHKPHMSGSPKDYPWDEGCSDTGTEGFYCPCDEMKITRIYGVGNRGTNAIWLESTSKVYFADDTEDYASGQIVHPNDSDIRDLKVGQIFKRGQLICYEGKDGATGNHLHISFGKGKIKGNGWVQNSKGSWVLTTTNGTYKPEELFFIDTEFTRVLNNKGLKFKALPLVEKPEQVKNVKATPAEKSIKLNWSKVADATGYYVFFYDTKKKKYTTVGSTKSTYYNVANLTEGTSYNLAVQAYKEVGSEKYWGKVSATITSKTVVPKTSYTPGTYQVNTKLLNVRQLPTTDSPNIPYEKLSKNARNQIYKLVGYKADGYVSGVVVTVSKVQGIWGKTPSGWICLDYCKKIK